MKASTIFSKTLKFVWLKLALGAATLVGSLVLLAMLGGIGIATNSGGVMFFMFIIWLALVSVMVNVLNHYFGYLIKAGHIAIVAQAVTTGVIPDDQFAVAKELVQQRFVTSNVYFVVDRLVSGAVRQLQNAVNSVDNLLGNVPGISFLLSIARVFIGIALGYVDECCLAYSFYKKEQGACKSAADGLVIYFQNWKILMKNALVLSLLVVGMTAVLAILFYTLLAGVFAAAGPIFAYGSIIIAILVAAIIKSAFIDSYIMVKMVSSYMEIAPTSEVQFDLYGKLCSMSKSFKKLFEKGVAETQPAQATAAPIL